jgi:toxin ParE1/3/4
MKRLVLTPRAKQDLNDIWDFIADDDIGAADRVLDALERRWSSWRRTQA